ncbi:hypothetical protein B4U80_05925 [Leptotrombidium deliense]|uniref:C3H1-type domain-containing protein n=1 Tax=Leptotrombidium deliense TaxID=299467 RepID=A0A443SDF4_9ACAR|nr:hypothetical protein B4U80_05925 [Leptotrombidium deliense]
MEVDERQQTNNDLKKESCVGAESIESDEDSQLVEEDDGELSDDNVSNDAKAEEQNAVITQQTAKSAQNEDELDYEEDVEEGEEPHKPKGDKEEDEDGEVNSDDDLEEGEVKEDSDGEERDGNANTKNTSQGQQQRQNRGQGNQKNICKFFHKGQCTWGPSCRFVHQAPSGMKQRKYNYPQIPPGPRPRPPDDYYYDHPPPLPPHMQVPRLPPPHVPPPIPPLPPATQEESPWERGLRHAKAAIVRASRRKEEDTDFDDKRFNLGVEDDQQSHHSRESLSPSSRARSMSPYHRERRDDYWSIEYERRRRLAYESAPWNEEPASPRNIPRNRESAEQYRDPWRRSKSPVNRRTPNQRRGGSNSGRRSNSMSSISGSDSASDLSGSTFSGSSFSGSESAFSDGSDIEKSPPATHKDTLAVKPTAKLSPVSAPVNQKPKNPVVSQRKGVTKPVVAKEKVQQPSIPAKSQPRTAAEEDSGAVKKKLPTERTRRDSWSDSESGSESPSGSSFYSGSESGSDISDSESEKKVLKRSAPPSKPVVTKNKDSGVRDTGPPAKKAKPTTALKQNKSDKSSNVKNVRQLSSESSPLPVSPTYSSMKSVSPPNSATESSQKKPIKMTFMKKHPNIKKDMNVTAKLNGGKGSDGEEDQNSGDNEGNEITSPEMISDIMKEESNTASESSKDMTPSVGDSKAKLAGSAVVSSTTGGASTSSRREELLKQLKAVEDAIARKRAKINN